MDSDKDLLPVPTCIDTRADRQPRSTGISDASRPSRSRSASARAFFLPALALPVLFFCVALGPAEVFGCAARGLLASGLALLSVSLGVFAAHKARRTARAGDPEARRWMLIALLLAVPAAAMLFLA